jgi:uncharacterized membrane protein
MLIALLALAGLFLSGYLTLYKLGYVGQLACAVGSCERVQSSRWSTLFGLPIAAWGAALYLTILVIALAGTQPPYAERRSLASLLAALTGFGVLFSAYLTSLELFVIHGICLYCLASAVIVTAMFGVSVWDWRRVRDQQSAVSSQQSGTTTATNAKGRL